MNKLEYNQYKNLLELSEEYIEIDWNGIETGIEWNDQRRCWDIEYRNVGVDFLLIHELGHIHLYKKTNYIYFAKKPDFNGIRSNIWWCHNAVIDSFVDYRISRFPEIYSQYKDYISAVITRNINPLELYEWFGGYIEYYLAYIFNLQDEDRRAFEIYYYRFINKVKSVIQQNTGLIDNQFDLIDSSLNNFGDLSSTENPNEIKNLDFEILKLFPLADLPTLKNQFKLLYTHL